MGVGRAERVLMQGPCQEGESLCTEAVDSSPSPGLSGRAALRRMDPAGHSPGPTQLGSPLLAVFSLPPLLVLASSVRGPSSGLFLSS